MAISQLQADISNLEELATGPITEQIEYAIEKDPLMTVLAQQLAFQEAQLTGLLTRFGENHREVLNLRESIEETKKQRAIRKAEIADITRQANLKDAKDYLIVLQEWFDELESRIQEAEQKQEELDNARVDYDKRLRIRDERQETLDEIKEQIEKWRTKANDPETPKVQSVGLAPRPLEMVFSRQWWMWLPSGTMLGFLLGIGLAFLVEMSNDLVRTPNEIYRFLRIPLLAIIPNASEDNRVRGIELCHAVRQAPYSIISEAYRRFSMNLKLSGTVESLRTILISSGMPGDGKTSTSVNLAATLVGSGKKVLLIDANFRKPSLNILFPKVNSNNLESLEAAHFNYGLSSVLMHQCSSSEAIRPSGIEGLDIIDCGPLPANPAELLSNNQMEELLKEQQKKYDHIIVDGAPVLLVSDAKAVAGLVDTTVLVFNADSTNIGAAQRTIREMRDVNANIAGCVLFAARTIKGGYFREQLKSYRKYLKAQIAGS
jgi:capsular exopolysaccharide synthesis family protein